MTGAAKFQFGTDFRSGGRRAAGEAELVEARAEGFRAGEAQGRAQSDAQMQGLFAQLQRGTQKLLATEDQRANAVETQAAHLAVAIAKAVAGAALGDRQLESLASAVRECLSHARGASHLAVRVTPEAVETVEPMIQRLARESGFGGRIVVLGEPEIAPGDGRIEWADGGLSLDGEQLRQMIDRAVLAVFGENAAMSQ